jgi:DNA recombination protein RmuC
VSGWDPALTAAVVVALLIVGAAIGAILVHLAGSRRPPKEGDDPMARLIAETAASRDAAEAADRRIADRIAEMRRAVEDRVQGVESRLADSQRSLTDHLGRSGRLLQDVGEKMGRIFETSQKIEKLAGDMTRLEDLLKPPKLRGALGETFLEQALRQVLPPRCWQMQYGFGDSVVDAAIFLGERIVPVDSKFPLENFRRARESAEESDRRRAQREFGADVRRHVEAIRARYIRPEAGTTDFALMYVPAEAVYSEIASETVGGDGPSLADYAVERRVIPVSPRLLYAYLATVSMGLKGLELQQSAREIGEKLAELGRLWDRVEEPFGKLGAHLQNTQKQYELATRALDRFAARLEGIGEQAQGELAETEEPLPLLPPS